MLNAAGLICRMPRPPPSVAPGCHSLSRRYVAVCWYLFDQRQKADPRCECECDSASGGKNRKIQHRIITPVPSHALLCRQRTPFILNCVASFVFTFIWVSVVHCAVLLRSRTAPAGWLWLRSHTAGWSDSAHAHHLPTAAVAMRIPPPPLAHQHACTPAASLSNATCYPAIQTRSWLTTDCRWRLW